MKFSKKDAKKIFGVLIALGLGATFLPIFDDPYHHKLKVNFWVWLDQEIDELLHGEKEAPEEKPKENQTLCE